MEQEQGQEPTHIGLIMPSLIPQMRNTATSSATDPSRCEKHDCELDEFRIGNYSQSFCPKCKAEKNAEEDKRRAAEWAAIEVKRIVDRLRDLDIGKRFANCTFENYKTDGNEVAGKVKKWCQRYAETFPDRLEAGDSIILTGKPGTGKNHLAAAICKAVITAGKIACHTTASKLVREIKATWGGRSDVTEKEVFARFLAPDLLVVDEIGVQLGTHAEQVCLMEIINDRYAAMKPTILISNLTVKELEAALGQQIVDRFYEGKSAVLAMNWGSYRKENSKGGA